MSRRRTLLRRRRVKRVVSPLRASDCSSLVLPIKQVLGQVSGGLPHTWNAVLKVVIYSQLYHFFRDNKSLKYNRHHRGEGESKGSSVH